VLSPPPSADSGSPIGPSEGHRRAFRLYRRRRVAERGRRARQVERHDA